MIVGDSVSGSPAVSHPWPLLLLHLLLPLLLSSGGNHCYCPTSLVAPTHSIHLINLHNHFSRNAFRRSQQNMKCWAATIERKSSKLTAQNRSHPSSGLSRAALPVCQIYICASRTRESAQRSPLPSCCSTPLSLSQAAGAFLLSCLLPGPRLTSRAHLLP